jgi:hypothetical protein
MAEKELICSMTLYTDHGLVECDEPACWKHPRYPTGVFCEKHKKSVAYFCPNGWSRVEESKEN